MNPHPDRRRLLQGGGALLLSLALVPRARACEFFCTSMRIAYPWTRASAPGATEAIVSMKFTDVLHDDRLVGASSPIATGFALRDATGAPIDFPIRAGHDSELLEGGPHLVLTGLRHELPVGREYPMTLVFERAGEVLADVDVAYARFG